MKAIKKDGETLIYINESNPGMKELLDRYAEAGYDIINMIPCPTCYQSGWTEQNKKMEVV
jgi:hypothetical protein